MGISEVFLCLSTMIRSVNEFLNDFFGEGMSFSMRVREKREFTRMLESS